MSVLGAMEMSKSGESKMGIQPQFKEVMGYALLNLRKLRSEYMLSRQEKVILKSLGELDGEFYT